MSNVQFSLENSWMSAQAWNQKLDRDARTVEMRVPPHLRDLHDAVVARSHAGGALALLLSGSTARGRRTEISDLDYHLIGGEIKTKDLPRELDLHPLTEDRLKNDICVGDDFVQWSLRFGLVVFDTGVIRDSHRLIAMRHPWPDPERKRLHATKSVDLARRFVETGDEDGAQEQVRTAISLTARAYLLAVGEFPLSRAELPGQLSSNGQPFLSQILRATIYESPSLKELSEGVARAAEILQDSASASGVGVRIRARKRVRV